MSNNSHYKIGKVYKTRCPGDYLLWTLGKNNHTVAPLIEAINAIGYCFFILNNNDNDVDFYHVLTEKGNIGIVRLRPHELELLNYE